MFVKFVMCFVKENGAEEICYYKNGYSPIAYARFLSNLSCWWWRGAHKKSGR